MNVLRFDSQFDGRLELHRRLTAFAAKRLKPSYISADWQDELERNMQLSLEEGVFLEKERREIGALMDDLPIQPDEFMEWFESLLVRGPGQNDELFPWLAASATFDQMRWFLKQEIAGEAGFDDLVALSQLRLANTPKLEMARNYWDEMGRGHEQGMHGEMLEKTSRAFALPELESDSVWEALALANLMSGLALNRRYAYQSIGALGVIEMTAPGRVSLVNDGLRRLGVNAEARQYFQLHAGLDIRHSAAWNALVITPLVEADPHSALPIAEGALMRLRAGQRCFDRYRAELWPGHETQKIA